MAAQGDKLIRSRFPTRRSLITRGQLKGATVERGAPGANKISRMARWVYYRDGRAPARTGERNTVSRRFWRKLPSRKSSVYLITNSNGWIKVEMRWMPRVIATLGACKMSSLLTELPAQHLVISHSKVALKKKKNDAFTKTMKLSFDWQVAENGLFFFLARIKIKRWLEPLICAYDQRREEIDWQGRKAGAEGERECLGGKWGDGSSMSFHGDVS